MSLRQLDTDSDTPWEDLPQNQEPEKLQLRDSNTSEKPAGQKKSKATKFLAFLLVAAIAGIVVLVVKLKSEGQDSRSGGTNKDAVTQKIVSKKDTFRENETDDCPQSNNGDSSICISEACVLAAAQIIQGMDQTVDPCEDFYEFSCGGWMRSRELPADSGHYATYSVLRDDVSIKLRGLLQESGEDDITSVQNAKNMYHSCVNEEKIESLNTAPFITLMEEFGGWPILGCEKGGRWKQGQFDLATLLVKIQKYNNLPLISVWVGMDDKNNSQNVIYVDQIWLGMQSQEFYTNDDNAAKKQAYRTLIYNTATLLGSTADNLDEQVDEIVDFETSLAKILVPMTRRRNINVLYNPITIEELQKNYTDLEQYQNIKFDWLTFLTKIIQLADTNLTLTEDEVVILQSPPYFEKLFPLLDSTPPKTIVNYAIWRIVKNRLVNMPQRFRNEIQNYNKEMSGTTMSPQRWKTCTRYLKHAFELVLGRMFVERYFSMDSKTEVLTMINNIRSAFIQMVEELDWMDAEMKTVAKAKADYMVAVIGSPDFIFEDDTLNKLYKEFQMDRDTYFNNVLRILQLDSIDTLSKLRKVNDVEERRRWLTSPTTVNAFYNHQRNLITFPAGILQPPYFHVDRPRYLNYGGIGFMIGHEITHGFDDVGRLYDKEGNLIDWWKPSAAALYKEKAQCLIDQYGEFFHPVAGRKLNAEQNQGENIADNGGVKEAYKAYRTLIKTNGGDEGPLLPGLNYTQNQLFYINFAQLRCELTRPEDALSHILKGAHSPNRFRVIGSLQNMPEFAEVFQCFPDSHMNPEKKCAVW